MTSVTTGGTSGVDEAVTVSVRFFAAAREAAGTDVDSVTLLPGTTVAGLISELCDQSDVLALVLQKCSYLCDGVAVRDRDVALRSDQTIDVLPPFAGG